MNKKQDFESHLEALTKAPVAFADGAGRMKLAAWTDSGNEISDEEILAQLRKAKERLDNDPNLFSGDPEGVYTYEDPILALAAYLHQANAGISSKIGVAGAEGHELRNAAFWNWVRTGVRAWLTRGDRSYTLLAGRTPRRSISLNKEKLRLAVVGDAGYRGLAQNNVIQDIRERHHSAPLDFIIHLGDVYFAGSGQEMLTNFLGPYMNIGPPVLTLLGNHDLYFGAEAYDEALKVLKQPGRYFVIENPHWRIACLDTALAAEKLLRNEGLLDPAQLSWLDELAADRKPLILMSHHFVVSGWCAISKGLEGQLRKRLKNVLAWYWGHEHSCATYDKKVVGFYGACVGNGAFLEVWKKPSRRPTPSWYATGRCSCYDARAKFWPHGYLELELQPGKILENFYLEAGETHSRTLAFKKLISRRI